MSTGPERADAARALPDAPDDGGMDNILASIRRILNAEEGAASPGEAAAGASAAEAATADASHHEAEEVFVLQPSMRVQPQDEDDASAVAPEPHHDAVSHDRHSDAGHDDRPPAHEATDDPMLAPETRDAAAQSIAALRSALSQGATRPTVSTVYRGGGVTVEDIVRDEVRLLLKNWLDHNLPPLVDRLVKAEIARVVAQGG